MVGSGRMWLAPSALEDPRAVRISMEAQGLPTEAIVKRYLPQVWLDSCETLRQCMTANSGAEKTYLSGTLG